MLIPQPANLAAILFFSTMSKLSKGALGMMAWILSLL